MKLRVFTLCALSILFFASAASAAPINATACRSDVKGYCAYSNPIDPLTSDKKGGFFEFAAESESFVVPGIEFLQIPGTATLGDILIRLYTWLLGLVGISAVVMVIWGGINYATAVEGNVKEAKDKIKSALAGLALALLAYLGLITINPDFVQKLDIENILDPIPGGSGTKELCIEGSKCTDITKNCTGTWVCNTDGTQKECKPDPTCKNEDNPGQCIVSVKCPNGKVETYLQKFNSAKACQAGCGNAAAKNACSGFETFDIVSTSCGTPKLPGQ